MPDIWHDVDATLAEVPVNLFPLLDDTDFKTREESVVYNQSGLDLVWNFVTTAGAYTQTAVTPTTGGGDYDWTNQGNGMYSIGMPASAGASINNNTEGFGWFSGFATGILPWRGPVIGFRASGLNDTLIDSAYSATRGLAGTALPAAAADAAGGLPISDAGGLDLDGLNTNVSSILTDTGTTIPGVLGSPAGADMSTDIAAIKSDTAATLTDTGTTLPGILGTPAAADMSTDIAAVKSDTAAVLTDTGTTLPATLSTIAGYIDTEVAAILTDTGTTIPALIATAQSDLDTLTGADGVTLATSQPNYAPSTHSVSDILTTQMTEAYAADGAAPTIAQALCMIQQMLGEFSISGTTLTVKKVDGSTTAATFTLNDGTSPTALTRAT